LTTRVDLADRVEAKRQEGRQRDPAAAGEHDAGVGQLQEEAEVEDNLRFLKRREEGR